MRASEDTQQFTFVVISWEQFSCERETRAAHIVSAAQPYPLALDIELAPQDDTLLSTN